MAEGVKLCSSCGELKPLSEFYRDKKYPDGHRACCKVCENAIHAKRVAAQRAYLVAYLGGVCHRCGLKADPEDFRFHHVRDKEFTIGNSFSRSLKKLKREADKCELLCTACHLFVHYEEEKKRLREKYHGPQRG